MNYLHRMSTHRRWKGLLLPSIGLSMNHITHSLATRASRGKITYSFLKERAGGNGSIEYAKIKKDLPKIFIFENMRLRKGLALTFFLGTCLSMLVINRQSFFIFDWIEIFLLISITFSLLDESLAATDLSVSLPWQELFHTFHDK